MPERSLARSLVEQGFCPDENRATQLLAELRGALEQVIEERAKRLIQKAQNHVDRAHNRALEAAIAELHDEQGLAIFRIRRLRRRVRWAEEFGER